MLAWSNCIRFLVVTVSILVLVPAFFLLFVGVWLLVNLEDSYSDSAIVLVLGGIVVLLATLGCGGAILQSRFMVAFFCTSLLALLVGQVTLIILLVFKNIDYGWYLTTILDRAVLSPSMMDPIQQEVSKTHHTSH